MNLFDRLLLTELLDKEQRTESLISDIFRISESNNELKKFSCLLHSPEFFDFISECKPETVCILVKELYNHSDLKVNKDAKGILSSYVRQFQIPYTLLKAYGLLSLLSQSVLLYPKIERKDYSEYFEYLKKFSNQTFIYGVIPSYFEETNFEWLEYVLSNGLKLEFKRLDVYSGGIHSYFPNIKGFDKDKYLDTIENLVLKHQGAVRVYFINTIKKYILEESDSAYLFSNPDLEKELYSEFSYKIEGGFSGTEFTVKSRLYYCSNDCPKKNYLKTLDERREKLYSHLSEDLLDFQ